MMLEFIPGDGETDGNREHIRQVAGVFQSTQLIHSRQFGVINYCNFFGLWGECSKEKA